MVGNLVIFLITWALLRFEGRSLKTLGLDQPGRRGTEFFLGFGIYGGMQVARMLSLGWVGEFEWITSPDYSLAAFGEVLWVLLQSVLFEELLFRGVVLVLVIRRLGVVRGCLLSSIAFGVYHLYSDEVFGERFVLMASIVLVTGAGGWQPVEEVLDLRCA